MNKKISQEFAIVVIILVSAIFGLLFWRGSENKNDQIMTIGKNTSDLEEKNDFIKKANDTTNNEKVTETIENYNSDKSETKRISGTGCYKETDTFPQFSDDFNLDAPNELVKYINNRNGISSDVPYNEKWGNKNCEVPSYVENKYSSNYVVVKFGRPIVNRYFDSTYSFYVEPKMSADDIIDLNEGAKRTKINNLDIVTYYSIGEENIVTYEITSSEYNYKYEYYFSSSINFDKNGNLIAGKEDTKNIKELEKVIESIKLIDIKIDVCNDLPEAIEIGSSIYPIDPKYENLRFLGQIFTASDCSEERLLESNGNSEEYDLGSTLILKNDPSDSLIKTMKDVGYFCGEDKKEVECRKWYLEKTVKLDDILKLKPYYKEFSGDDCINCG